MLCWGHNSPVKAELAQLHFRESALIEVGLSTLSCFQPHPHPTPDVMLTNSQITEKSCKVYFGEE